MRSAFVFILGFLLAQSAVAIQPLKTRVQSGDQLVIQGYRGKIRYTSISGARDLAVKVTEPQVGGLLGGSEWQFSMRREENTIRLVVDSPMSKMTWAELLSRGENRIPSYDLEVIGPSLPLQIHWHDGSIQLQNYTAGIAVTQITGRLEVSGGEGDVEVHQQEGFVSIKDRKGNVRVDSYNATVLAQNIEGQMQLENFTGKSDVKNVKGQMQLVTYKGETKVDQIEGSLDFTNGISPLNIKNLKGELRGKSLQGPVFASIQGEANVRLKSEEGAVSLRLPRSGAWVNAGTAEGHLNVPNFLKLTRLASKKIRTGRLRGSLGGRIFVRTTKGDIRIR